MGLVDRSYIYKVINTGYLSVYTFANTSIGQRQLLIGQHSVGKTSLISNVFKNIYNNILKEEFDSCFFFLIFISIGSPRREFFINKGIHITLNKLFTSFVDCTSGVSPFMQYFIPFNIFSFSNNLLSNGLNVSVSLDSLDKHAKSFREVMLSLKRAPGREAYPGDVFFLHSNLLEKFGQLSLCHNLKGSTGLPVVGIMSKSGTDYITTNLISITDGQWNLLKSLSISSKFPSIGFNSSVSRIGFTSLMSFLKSFLYLIRSFINFFIKYIDYSLFKDLLISTFYMISSRVYSSMFNLNFYSINLIFVYLLFNIFQKSYYFCNSILDVFFLSVAKNDIKIILTTLNWCVFSSFKFKKVLTPFLIFCGFFSIHFL